MTLGAGVAGKKIESLPAINKTNWPTAVTFILTLLAIGAAVFYFVPDAWWGLGVR
jgi:hypothetical protein